jgi:hypothetical protein
MTFNGVVLQKANHDSGYFLGTNQSGRVERHRLKPNQHLGLSLWCRV